MPSLSAIVIARNEADNIKACLAGLAFADERLVIDGGSEDPTVAIAETAGARVVVLADWQGFGVQRQRAEALAQGDWILMVDADERVSNALADEIREALDGSHSTGIQVFEIPRLTAVFGQNIRHGGWYPDPVARLYAREAAGYDAARVHERLVPKPGVGIGRLEHPLLHQSYRDLPAYLAKSSLYATEWANEREVRGKRASLGQGFLHALGCFVRMYWLRAGFLDGSVGFLLAVLSAHSTFIKYAELWLRGRKTAKNARG